MQAETVDTGFIGREKIGYGIDQCQRSDSRMRRAERVTRLPYLAFIRLSLVI
jgi:hypothetical protein